MVLELGRLHDVRTGWQVPGQHHRGGHGRDGREQERKGVASEDDAADGTDGRADGEATHLERAVEAEGLAALVRIGRLDEHAACRGLIHAGRRARDEAQREERREAREEERQEAGHGEDEQADEHLRPARSTVGPPAEERLGDELRDGPGRHDEAELPGVQALLLDEERQHGQQRTESDGDDELGDEERQERTPPSGPRRDATAGIQADRDIDLSVARAPSAKTGARRPQARGEDVAAHRHHRARLRRESRPSRA